MRRSIYLFATLAIALMVAHSAAQEKHLDAGGYYYIEKPSKAFADIDFIALDGDYGLTTTPVTYGLVRVKGNNTKTFRLLKPTLVGTAFSFRTRAVGGMSYSFTGSFTQLFVKNQASQDNLNGGGIVLKGTLTKLKSGRKIASQVVNFTYFTGT